VPGHAEEVLQAVREANGRAWLTAGEPAAGYGVHLHLSNDGGLTAMRSILLWALGVPIPIIILIWLLYW